MKVVVVGSGGREHGLALVLGRHAEVVVTPGNPLIPGSVATPVEELVEAGDVDLVVFGPEQPLVAGHADRLRHRGVRVFGPGLEGAQLEGSKAYMKLIAQEAGVPTAAWRSFTHDQLDEALDYLGGMHPPFVVKTDGLAAGKGVLVTDSPADAATDVESKLRGRTFGEAGRQVVIEEGLVGTEVSVFAICDGERSVCLPAAQDVKRVGDGDVGPNTGGIGAWSPLPFVDGGFEEEVNRVFVQPVLAELRQRGIEYRGCLYVGLMLTAEGPKLVEYNVRFGDPDSQPVLLRMTSDLAALLAAAADGDLTKGPAPTFSDDVAVLVVACAEGYPVAPRTGDPIGGLDAARGHEGVTVLGAGVGADRATGELRTAGGRVLDVIGIGPDVATARQRAYGALAELSWPGEHHRTDIAPG